jgi:arsenate reductase-like glutaredoxin family protein
MNIQIFGKKKCKDTKKAEMFFKERRIKFQKVDMNAKGLSMGELESVLRSIDMEDLVDTSSKLYQESLYEYTSDKERKKEVMIDFPEIIKTPIVRNGKSATLGYQPEVWKTWT